MNSLYSAIGIVVREKFSDDPPGIFSICSSNLLVLNACMRACKKKPFPILIEATCNQVNQFGGYTGMKPKDFSALIKNLANKNSLNEQSVYIGGDHLGPSVWMAETPDTALEKSVELVKQYVYSGFRKIHLDASMPCRGDPIPLPAEIISEREARLCRAAVDACETAESDLTEMVFVIGTEVPTPGGSSEETSEINISSVSDTISNIESSKVAFASYNLEQAWQQTLAFVVQPGVEFGDRTIYHYDKGKAADLSRLIERYDNLIFEAHSTDYQLRDNLKQMVNNHFSILKVGPALTFALREAVFALEMIEKTLFSNGSQPLSNFSVVLDETMRKHPQYWKNHYHQDPIEAAFQRKYSLLDRSRYYWSNVQVDTALQRLLSNLQSRPIPISLLSQFMPNQSELVKAKLLDNTPLDLIYAHIEKVIDDYRFACGFNQ